jgi:hypothetical protein
MDYFSMSEAADGITTADLERLRVREFLNLEQLPQRNGEAGREHSLPESACPVCLTEPCGCGGGAAA